MQSGLYCSNVSNVIIQGNLAEGNAAGIKFNEFTKSMEGISLNKNTCWFNSIAGISSPFPMSSGLKQKNVLINNHDETDMFRIKHQRFPTEKKQ